VKLGTAVWQEGPAERRAVVAQLPSDPNRVVDLNRLEHLRLAKLGEGHAETLADALVPSTLGRLLEGGPRAIHRARQVVAYAEKWERRSGLPESLAPRLEEVRLLPCLPQPSVMRRWDGTHLDRLAVQGPGGTLSQAPVPTIALLGLTGGHPAGCCLAVDDARGVVLGAWLELDVDWDGVPELTMGTQHRRLALDGWRGLTLPPLRPCEVLLAPPPHLRLTHAQAGLEDIRITSPFETLTLRLGEALVHPTVQ
jgi:hypothetical protein